MAGRRRGCGERADRSMGVLVRPARAGRGRRSGSGRRRGVVWRDDTAAGAVRPGTGRRAIRVRRDAAAAIQVASVPSEGHHHAHHPSLVALLPDRRSRSLDRRLRAARRPAHPGARSAHAAPTPATRRGQRRRGRGRPSAGDRRHRRARRRRRSVAAVDDAKIIRTGTMSARGQGRRERPARRRATRIVAPRRLRRRVDDQQRRRAADRPRSPTGSRPTAGRTRSTLLRGLNGLTTKVVTEHTEAVEVTGQVVDLEARIKNLRASETALQAIAAKAIQDQRRPRGPGAAHRRRAARSRS